MNTWLFLSTVEHAALKLVIIVTIILIKVNNIYNIIIQ